MAEVEFDFNGNKKIIQCGLNDKINNICQIYLNKINKDKNDVYFSYNGNTKNIFNEELTFTEMINSEDKERNKMNILVFKNEIKFDENDFIKSKNIICPKCGESIRFEVLNYRIKLSECKNGHKIDNILLSEFENTQYINNKYIICEICNHNNKSNSNNKKFFKCLDCKKNVCPLCLSKHDKEHKVINYDERFYACDKHYRYYNSYCEKCKINLCSLCEENHKKHKISYFKNMLPNKNGLIESIKIYKEKINLLEDNIQKIINFFKEIIKNLNTFHKINEDIINNYNSQKINYEILYSLNNMKNITYKISDLEYINKANIKDKVNSIFNIYYGMNIYEINIFILQEIRYV